MVRKKSKRTKKNEALMLPFTRFMGLTSALLSEHQKPLSDRKIIHPSQDFRKDHDKLEEFNEKKVRDDDENIRVYMKILKEMGQAKYYEVDRELNKHLQGTKPLDVRKATGFAPPFDRIFVSTKIDAYAYGRNTSINGILLKKRSLYAMTNKKKEIFKITDKNMERCMCGKYKHQHLGTVIPEYDSTILSGHGGPAEGCEQFTWNGGSVAIEMDGYECSYMITFDPKGNDPTSYINNTLLVFSYPELCSDWGDATIQNSKASDIIRDYMINLIAFLTLKERVYVEKDRSRSMVRRHDKGMLPIPSSTLITCDNKTKIYFTKYKEAIESGGKAVIRHDRAAFWREYKHKRYVNVPMVERPDGLVGKYQWIKPTIVGDGLYLPKHRRVREV
jgi:hypothetical protein